MAIVVQIKGRSEELVWRAVQEDAVKSKSKCSNAFVPGLAVFVVTSDTRIGDADEGHECARNARNQGEVVNWERIRVLSRCFGLHGCEKLYH